MKRSLVSHILEFSNTYRSNKYAIKPYLVKDGKVHPVAIICPGGGYRRVCSFVEGHPFAKKLNTMGYHAIILFYRIREKAAFPNPQDDLARAVKEIHEHAKEWKLDMTGYSIWGSSAGGHLAASFGTESIGYVKYGLPKPGAMILIYPVITMGKYTHPGSRNYLIGSNPAPEDIEKTSIEGQITAAYPPTFLWWGDADQSVNPINSLILKAELEKHQIPCKCVEYPDVGHGVGLGKGMACEGWIADAVTFWMKQREEHSYIL